MTDASSTLARLLDWRRAPAFAGLVVLALLHVSAASHEFTHDVDHAVSVCEACSAYSQLEDAGVPVAQSVEAAASPYVTCATPVADEIRASFTARYCSRAPPLS